MYNNFNPQRNPFPRLVLFRASKSHYDVNSKWWQRIHAKIEILFSIKQSDQHSYGMIFFFYLSTFLCSLAPLHSMQWYALVTMLFPFVATRLWTFLSWQMLKLFCILYSSCMWFWGGRPRQALCERTQERRPISATLHCKALLLSPSLSSSYSY